MMKFKIEGFEHGFESKRIVLKMFLVRTAKRKLEAFENCQSWVSQSVSQLAFSSVLVRTVGENVSKSMRFRMNNNRLSVDQLKTC